jgi:hypothetical protein
VTYVPADVVLRPPVRARRFENRTGTSKKTRTKKSIQEPEPITKLRCSEGCDGNTWNILEPYYFGAPACAHSRSRILGALCALIFVRLYSTRATSFHNIGPHITINRRLFLFSMMMTKKKTTFASCNDLNDLRKYICNWS